MDRPPPKKVIPGPDAGKPSAAASDEPSVPPLAPETAPAAPSTVSDPSLRRTAPLPAPTLEPRGKRPGMRTESLPPPSLNIPSIEIPPPPENLTPEDHNPEDLTPADVKSASNMSMAETIRLDIPAAPPSTSQSSPEAPQIPNPALPFAAPEDQPRPASPRGKTPPRPISTGIRLAARRSPELSRPVAWGATLVVILVMGWMLWLGRQPLSASIERWFTLPSWTTAEEAPIVVDRPISPDVAPVVEEDLGPQWTFTTLEEALLPLPEQLQALSLAGQQEQADFADLARRGAPAALQRSRWENWRVVWSNRIGVLRQASPPVEECLPHVALRPTCQLVDTVLGALEKVESAATSEDALPYFEEAEGLLIAWQEAKEAEAAEAAALEEAALEAAALEAAALEEAALEEVAPVEVEDLLEPQD